VGRPDDPSAAGIGHEFVGEIVAVGSNVTDFLPEDRSVARAVVCGRCQPGRPAEPAPRDPPRGRAGQRLAEYVACRWQNIWHHWRGSTWKWRRSSIRSATRSTPLAFPVLGEDVLVSGAGPIRLMATAVVRHAGARFTSSRATFRRELALRMGATVAIDPRERDIVEVGAELGMVEGFDVALEMSGKAAALRSAIGAMAHGGGIAILGIPTEDIPIDVNQIVFKMLTLRGIYGREMYETWYKMTVMIQSGLDIRPAITHRFGFLDHEAAFAAATSGDSGKVVMRWD
jgi:threonine 3-dehydrogenase